MTIEYCVTCNYRPMAASLALKVKQEKTDIDMELRQSGEKGAFEVSLEGDLLFSKLKSNRFPSHEEILSLIKDKIGGR